MRRLEARRSSPPRSRSRASRSARPAPFRGRNPSNRNRLVGRPDSTSAVSTALGPGTTSTATPRLDARPHEVLARIRDAGHPGVAHVHDPRAAADRVDDATRFGPARCARAPRAAGSPPRCRPRCTAARACGACPPPRSRRRRAAPRPRAATGRRDCRSASRRGPAQRPRPPSPVHPFTSTTSPRLELPAFERAGGRLDREVRPPDRAATRAAAQGSCVCSTKP